MKISTKSRYGIRALYDLTIHQGKGPVQLRDIARRQMLSEKYLEQLMSKLKNNGLIRSVRGPQGGYFLKRSAEDILVLEIFEILEGPLEPVPCTSSEHHCSLTTVCAAHDLWEKLKYSFKDVLESITLADLAREQRIKENQWVNMYYI